MKEYRGDEELFHGEANQDDLLAKPTLLSSELSH
jgi:hypothetical protein